ncbi:MAG: translation initiation factor IF-2 N-terminal domain-containing protein, partial [Pelobacteraceae bacterium]
MGKISVGSLAKTLGIEPKDAIARLKEIGVDAKTATSQVDEGVVARLTAPQPKDTSTDEVRVASNIIRRRAKVVPVVEGAEAAVAEEVAPAQPSVTPQPKAAKTAEKPAAAAAAVRAEEEQKVVAAVAAPAPVEEPAAVKPAEAVKAGPNQARILGMMEIPGVTNRPTRVVTKDTPVTPRTAPLRTPQDSMQPRRPAPAAGDQRRPAPGTDTRRPSPGYDQKRPASTTPSAPATELDRSRMKQVQLA